MAIAAAHVTKKTDTTTHYFATELENRQQMEVAEPNPRTEDETHGSDVEDTMEESPASPTKKEEDTPETSGSESEHDDKEKIPDFKKGDKVKTPNGVGTVTGTHRGRVGVMMDDIITGYPSQNISMASGEDGLEESPRVQTVSEAKAPPTPPANPTPTPEPPEPAPADEIDDRYAKLLKVNTDLEKQLVSLKKALSSIKSASPQRRIDPSATHTQLTLRTEGLDRQTLMYKKENEFLAAKLSAQAAGPSHPVLRTMLNEKADELKELKAENRRLAYQLKTMEQKLSSKDKLEEVYEKRRSDCRAEMDLHKIKVKKMIESRTREQETLNSTSKILEELQEQVTREHIQPIDTKVIKETELKLEDKTKRIGVVNYQTAVLKKSHNAEKMKLQRNIKNDANKLAALKRELEKLETNLQAKQEMLTTNLRINHEAKQGTLRHTHTSGNKLQPLPVIPHNNGSTVSLMSKPTSSPSSTPNTSHTPLSSSSGSVSSRAEELQVLGGKKEKKKTHTQPCPPTPKTPKTPLGAPPPSTARKHNASKQPASTESKPDSEPLSRTSSSDIGERPNTASTVDDTNKPVERVVQEEAEEKPVEEDAGKEAEEKPVEEIAEKETEEKPVEKDAEKEAEEKPVEGVAEKEAEEKPIEEDDKASESASESYDEEKARKVEKENEKKEEDERAASEDEGVSKEEETEKETSEEDKKEEEKTGEEETEGDGVSGDTKQE